MLNKLKMLMAFAIAGIGGQSLMAADETVTIGGQDGLWSKLGVEFGTIVNDCFEALATPIGIVVMVVFTMAIFYLSVGLVRRAISPSRRV